MTSDSGSDGAPDADLPTDSGSDIADVVSMDTGDAADASVLSTPWGLSTGNGMVPSVAVDNQQNVLIGGWTTFSSQSTGFFQKLDGAGNPKWKVTFNSGGNAQHTVYAVAFDGQGNALVAGYTGDNVNIGGGMLAPGSFIAKFDSAGTFLWQKGGLTAVRYDDIATRANGNVVSVGQILGPTDFGGGTITPSYPHAVAVELNSAGNYVNAKEWGGMGYASASRLAIDGNNNTFLTGYFEVSITFGGLTFSGPSCCNNGPDNWFIAKVDNSFGHLASMDLSTVGASVGQLGLDNGGNVYVTGALAQSVNLGGGALVSAGSNDVYAAKLDSTLKHQWSKRYGDNLSQIARAAVIDKSGNMVITGSYQGSMNLGCGPLAAVGGNPELFVAVLDGAGNCKTSTHFAKDNTEPFAVRVATPDIVIGGQYFGPLMLPGGTLLSNNSQQGFVARFQP